MTTTKTAPVTERKGSKIDLGARLVMTALYKRLFSLGLWEHIRSVGGTREKGIGGAYFVTHDNRAFFDDLIRSQARRPTNPLQASISPSDDDSGEFIDLMQASATLPDVSIVNARSCIELRVPRRSWRPNLARSTRWSAAPSTACWRRTSARLGDSLSSNCGS